MPEQRRQEIFAALVMAQDDGVDAPESRSVVAARFGVSEERVRQIEREGKDKDWPPL